VTCNVSPTQPCIATVLISVKAFSAVQTLVTSKACTRVSKKQSVQHPKKTATVLSEDGRPISDPGKQLDRWADHFSSLYNKDVPVKLEAINALALIPTLHELDADIPLGMEKVAIKLLKNNKASQADGIPAEVLKCGGEALSAELHAVFELCAPTVFRRTSRMPTLSLCTRTKEFGRTATVIKESRYLVLLGKSYPVCFSRDCKSSQTGSCRRVNVVSMHRAQPLTWCSH